MKHPAKNSSRNFRCCRTFCTDETFPGFGRDILFDFLYENDEKSRTRPRFFAVTSLFTREIVEK